MSELARLEAERLHQQQLQEEALRRERLLRERENEQRERAQMALAEQQCRSVWEEMKRLVEARRLDEQWCMQAEDALSAAVREAVHQAKVKMQSYIALAAQEDVEYDLGNYGSDSDCDTMSDWEGEETPPQGAYLDTSRSISAAPPAAASAVSVAASPVVKPVPPSMPATMPGPVVTRTLRAAPAKAKPVVSVDPTQGKKWGGSISTAWNSISGSAEPAAPSNDGGGAYGESAVEGTPGGVTVVETQLLPPPRSAAEQRELETHWQQLVRQGAQICARSIDFAPTSVAKAQALFDTLLYKGGKSTPIENKHSKPPLIQALRHWQAYWSEQQLQHQQLKTRAASLSASGNPHEKKKEHNNNKQTTTAVTLTPARDLENEKALQNSMVDLETDPLLAKELDFCVEGLFSTNFLHQFKNLSKLAINVNKISELNGLRDLSMLLHISAKDNRISSVEALGNLKQLRFLYLDSNKLTDLSPLDGLDQLVVLTANSNSLTEFPCLECVSLQRLELCRNRIPSIPAHALWGVPNLNHLNLSSNQLTEVSGHALSACGSLQTLILSENQLSAVPAPLRLPLLKNLRLNLNRITNLEAWKHQDQSGDGGDSESSSVWPFFAPSLQKLVLSDNQISSLADVFCLLPLLEELDLSFNALAAQEAVEGIRQCKLLTALHVQDNLFTTVPVNTGGAAGTSRTALPAPQQAALNQWLCALCPNLETISGNRLDKVEFAEAHLQRRPGQILTHYSQYRTWLPPDFNVQDLYYQHDSMECRQLIHLLQAHHHSQNTMAVKERAVKKDEVAANKSHSKRVNSTSAEQAKVVPAATRNWESELSNLLTMQREQLLRRGCEPEGALDNTIHNKSVVFVSYKKATPGVISLDQITSTTPVLVAEVADPRMFGATKVSGHDAESSRSSKPRPNYNSNEVNFIALSMQKRFRGRRVRQRLGNALQSFRYKDNELDDLFAGEEFNFEQEMADLSFLDSHDDAPAVMVYGDHIRKRSRPTSSVKASQPASAPVVANANMADSTAHLSSNLLLPLPTANHWILPEDDRNSPPKQSQGAGAVSGPGGGVRTGAGAYGVAATTSNFYRQQQPLNDSRPGTGMTSVSSISAHTTDAPDASASALLQSGANSPAASRSALSSRSEGPQDMQHDQASTMSSARRSNRATAAVLAQEWGISDPKVLATMIKRNQRIRYFKFSIILLIYCRSCKIRVTFFLFNACKFAEKGTLRMRRRDRSTKRIRSTAWSDSSATPTSPLRGWPHPATRAPLARLAGLPKPYALLVVLRSEKTSQSRPGC